MDTIKDKQSSEICISQSYKEKLHKLSNRCHDKPEVCILHKTIMQCTYFGILLSEAINERSSIIEDHTIQTKYIATNRCVKIIFIIPFMD